MQNNSAQNNSEQNNHELTFSDNSASSSKTLTLWRFPKQAVSSALQAWDSADQILIEHVLQHHNDITKPLIINDSFGALTCGLNNLAPSVYSDSKVSSLAITENLENNNQSAPNQIAIQQDPECIKSHDNFILKVPNNLDYLQFLLLQIHQSNSPNIQILASAKAKDITKTVVKLFQRYFEYVDISLTKRKARIITAHTKKSAPYSSFKPWQTWTTKHELTLTNAANVFSRGSLDQGADFLLAYLPDCNNKDVIDLAAGNGVLGLTLIKTQSPKSVVFTDESAMAINSIDKNLNQNALLESAEVKLQWQDCLTEVASETADVIVCNPPFHQQKAITDHIAIQMFNDAKRVLRKGGELRIVGNQHLGYFEKLSVIFGNTKVIATNQKFVIITAYKD